MDYVIYILIIVIIYLIYSIFTINTYFMVPLHVNEVIAKQIDTYPTKNIMNL